jgi:hypothetical protein
MITSGNQVANGTTLNAQLVVIGAGPAGIVSALEAARRGIDVIVVETGGKKPNPACQRLSEANRTQPDAHAPVEIAVSRRLGGTSSIWGGRCVPYDRVDFTERAVAAHSRWPIGYDDVEPYFDAACRWMVCGRPVFDATKLNHLPRQMIPGLEDGAVLSSSLERWSLPTDFGKVYFDELRNTPNLRVFTDSTCVGITLDGDGALAESAECRTLSGSSFMVRADDVIVACGGLEATRLLMCSPGPNGRSIGDHSGHLGRWYMAHLEGIIADLVLSTPRDETIYWYERDIDGSYVRRRFTFEESYLIKNDLPNISGWIANPELADAAHRNAARSLTYLVLISPIGFLLAPTAQRLSLTGTKIPGTPYGMTTKSSVWSHLRNLLAHPLETARFAFVFGTKRVFSRGRKPPGFFVANPNNRYPLQYHAEHLPHYESRVMLSTDLDELGMPRLEIDIHFTDDDVAGVVEAHRHWDLYLRKQGVGRLEYQSDDLAAAVLERAGGGYHQVGTTRMAGAPEDGVVDENLTVHGVSNLHVVSSSVFVTSSQANSTFMVVVFALRLIERLYGID